MTDPTRDEEIAEMWIQYNDDLLDDEAPRMYCEYRKYCDKISRKGSVEWRRDLASNN